MDRKTDVVVLGAGLAGLAAATYLARTGRSVVVLEKSAQPGGRARTRTKAGFHFNVGPHALYPGGAASAVLHELGVRFRGRRPDGRGALGVKGEGLHPLPLTPSSLLTTGLMGFSAKWELARLMRHLRARRVMASYDQQRTAPLTVAGQRAGRALERFLSCLAQGDAAGLESVLARDVRSTSDAGGEFAAARREVTGAGAVAHLYLGLARKLGRVTGLRWLTLNGHPALEIRSSGVPAGWAPRAILQAETDAEGRIRRLYSVMATCKLTAVDAGAPSAAVSP